MEQQINLVGKTDQQAVALLRSSLDQPEVWDSIMVTVDNHGAGILDALQQQLWGRFEWYPIQPGPPVWQFMLTRTAAKMAKRGIGEFLGADHRRCDELFIELENAVQANDSARAQTLFSRFTVGMEHHFAMEEEVFFPAFEQATGMTQGPTMVMRVEHRQMRGLIGQAAQAMAQGKLEGVGRACATLMILMRQHNIKEEQMLYPMADQHLGGTVDGLVRSMQKHAAANMVRS